MVTMKPRIVIIGAGMAGLTAANKLYTSSSHLFDLTVVEGGSRIGGRINTSEFGGDRIEEGATWIHGIEGSPVYKIATETGLLESKCPWECMDGVPEPGARLTVAEGGHVLDQEVVAPVSNAFNLMMDYMQGEEEVVSEGGRQLIAGIRKDLELARKNTSAGEFLRQGLKAYWAGQYDAGDNMKVGSWSRKEVEEAVFAMNESVQRTYTSADDLYTLDYNAESEYVLFPGEEITIAKGYSRVIEHLASVLPPGMVQFGKKVKMIEWQSESFMPNVSDESTMPVRLHFCDGSVMSADHVIVTVSLGVLKHGIRQDSGMFNPPLPNPKCLAISRLGYGVVNKVFVRLSNENFEKFPYLQMAFHQTDGVQDPNIPHWFRRTSFITPIHSNSSTVLSWFTGDEAILLESLPEEEIINGFKATISSFLPASKYQPYSNGTLENGSDSKSAKVLRTQWGTNPLFLGSYSYIAVGSTTDDMDTLAEPLPLECSSAATTKVPEMQILFAGEATHRTHYSTTHGAYYSGIREADRLLKHYNCAAGV